MYRSDTPSVEVGSSHTSTGCKVPRTPKPPPDLTEKQKSLVTRFDFSVHFMGDWVLPFFECEISSHRQEVVVIGKGWEDTSF